jgi:hypothetical protein
MKSNVDAQIATFLFSVLTAENPDYVVTVERKGTALLRTLVASGGWDVTEPLRTVVASDALHFLKDGAFVGKRILLLDDAMYQGRRIMKAKKYLLEQKHVQASQIKVAAFSVHEQVEPGMADYSWFGRLRDEGFRSTRDEMVRSFQESGSLLLATERIGVVAELQCGRGDFFDALCKLGIGVEAFSVAGRLNLTVHNPELPDGGKALLEKLPQSATIEGAIRKLRIVERKDGLFAICPIFYPATPASVDSLNLRPCDEWLKLLLGRDYAAATDPAYLPIAVFQAVALMASVALLESVAVALQPLTRPGKISIKVPMTDKTGVLSHLRMLFPLIDESGVVQLIQTAIQPAKENKRSVRLTKRPLRVGAGVGTAGAATLGLLHWQLLKQTFFASERNFLRPSAERAEERETLRSPGATWRQIKALVGNASTTPFDSRAEALLSAALDKAIDEADIVTGVDTRLFADDILRLVRVFRPDGEFIQSDMRRICAMWKKDIPPPAW